MTAIDITMTATIRPELIRETLGSFKRNLFLNHPCKLIINVDPVGEKQDPAKIVDIAREYFPTVKFRISPKPHFGRAFKWCWSEVEADLVFHLEEDWELLQEVDLQAMINLLNLEPDLAILRLPAFKANENNMKNWNLFFKWNGRYFECPHDHRTAAGFSGHPSLIRSEFVKSTRELLIEELNPEKQFHYKRIVKREVLKWRYGVFSQPNHPAYIRDMGREWMIKNRFAKQGVKGFFTQWVEIDELRQ